LSFPIIFKSSKQFPWNYTHISDGNEMKTNPGAKNQTCTFSVIPFKLPVHFVRGFSAIVNIVNG
jgi:hypothetical protein